MKIKYLVMDVDGTLTDGKIYMGSNGEIMKAFNIKDGYGIRNILIPAGIEPVVLTGRISEIVTSRCQELGIEHIYQGANDKLARLYSITQDLSEISYIGDDLNDFECMVSIKKSGGIIGCPRNAVSKVIQLSDYIAEHDGGEGAVRDFVEWLVSNQSNIGV